MLELTIIMYHYVRPIKVSSFPGIKGLELKAFCRQLDYLEENYRIVSTEEVIEACLKNSIFWKKIQNALIKGDFADFYGRKENILYLLWRYKKSFKVRSILAIRLLGVI